MAHSKLTKEDKNYMRLQLLSYKIATNVVREFMGTTTSLSNGNIDATLAAQKRHARGLKGRIITPDQWNLLYPPVGASVNVNNFDLTLLIVLLRNYGNLGEPAGFDWKKLPISTDVSSYHDLVRIKTHRNKLAHLGSCITDSDFEIDWKDLSDAILRLSPPTKHAYFQQEIDFLKTAPFNQDDLVQSLNDLRYASDGLSVFVYDLEDKLDDIVLELNDKTEEQKKEIINKVNFNVDSVKTALQQEIHTKAKEMKSHIGETVGEAVTSLIQNSKENTEQVIDGISHSAASQSLKTENQLQQHTEEIKKHIDSKLETSNSGNKKKKTRKGVKNRDVDFEGFARKLKKVYKDKFRKVQSVSSDGVPTMFDVTSKLYMDLDCTPLEMRCTSVHDQTTKKEDKSQKRPHMHPGRESTSKRFKGETSTSLNQCDNKDSAETFLDPGPSTSFEEDIHEKQISKIHTEKGVKSVQDKPTTTAQISRLCTKAANPDNLPILIEAEAGVGKTTLFHRLILDWANESIEMEEFKLVFFIPLRRVKSKKIEDIICDDLKLFLPEHKRNLKRCLDFYDNQILYLIDGLDEVTLRNDNQLKNLLQEAGRQSTTTEYSVFCSSRPMLEKRKERESYHGMEDYLLVKLLGFSDETLTKYINQYFRELNGDKEIDSNKVIAECSKHFYCRALIKIPLYAGLLCFLWEKYKDEFPETATQLFNRFLREVLTNYYLRHSNPPGSCSNKLHILGSSEKMQFVKSPMEKTIPPKISRTLMSISKLAYTTLLEGKVIFTVEDAGDSYLSLEDLTHIGLFSIEDEGELIYFRHKLFHEYFAGLHLTLHGGQIYTIFNDSREEIISRSHILQNAFFFAAGLCQETYERIVFGLKYSLHLLDNSDKHMYTKACKTCVDKNDYASSYNSSFRESHKKLCDDNKGRDGEEKHEYDIEKVGECDNCYKMANAIAYPSSTEGRDTSLDKNDEPDLQAVSFFVQLAFENHQYITNRDIVYRLPVHCSSAHSLAAALYILGMIQRKEYTSIVLIGGSAIDIDQLLCILNECRNNENIKCITLLKADEALIREILNIEWTFVEKLGFEECYTLVPIADVVQSFKKVEVVFIDECTWESKEMLTGGVNGGIILQNVKVIVADCAEYIEEDEYVYSIIEEETVEDREIHVDSKEPLLLARVYNHANRGVSVFVENYEDWPQEDREKCLPDSVIKGICACRLDNYCDHREDCRLTGVIHPFGLQWEHTDVSEGYEDETNQPVISVGLKDLGIVLSVNVIQTDYYDEIIEAVRHLYPEDNRSLSVHQTVIPFICKLLQKEWTGVCFIVFTECDIIVPVDILAKVFPDLEKVQYDRETLEHGGPLAQIQDSGTTPETTDDFCVCFQEVDDAQGNHNIENCRSCDNNENGCIYVALERGWLSQPRGWECLFYSSKMVKGLCWLHSFTLNPAIKHLEYIHVNETRVIADIYKQNPDLKEVVLDWPHDIQHHEPMVNEVLTVLKGNGQQWSLSSFLFHCECGYGISTTKGEPTRSCLNPLEVSNNKVQSWCRKDFDVLTEHEHFVLHHYAFHNATEEERREYQTQSLSKENILSWMAGIDSIDLEGVDSEEEEDFRDETDSDSIHLDSNESNEPHYVCVYNIKDNKVSAKFTKDEQ